MTGGMGAQIDAPNGQTFLESEGLCDALFEHKLLVFRDLKLTPGRLADIAARFGELDDYPFAEPLKAHPKVCEVRKELGDSSNFGGAWHTDTSYLEQPPAITLLYAVTVPASGGDTLFADMVAAYDALSPGLQQWLAARRGVNTSDLVHGAGGAYAAVDGDGRANMAGATQGLTARHPIVRKHPHTGAAALYTCAVHTQRFSGMTERESAGLLAYLHGHATRAEFTHRLNWHKGTLAIWDNRLVQHYPLNDYDELRVMHRVIVRGERPVPFDPVTAYQVPRSDAVS
jgi:taurine dioxygenase